MGLTVIGSAPKIQVCEVCSVYDTFSNCGATSDSGGGLKSEI